MCAKWAIMHPKQFYITHFHVNDTLGYVVNSGNVQNGILLILFQRHLPMFGIKPEHTALNTASQNAMRSIWPSIPSVRNELETLSMTHYFISVQTIETFKMHFKEYLHFYTVLACSMQYTCIPFRRLSKWVIIL